MSQLFGTPKSKLNLLCVPLKIKFEQQPYHKSNFKGKTHRKGFFRLIKSFAYPLQTAHVPQFENVAVKHTKVFEGMSKD
jgi:hypothetical protein